MNIMYLTIGTWSIVSMVQFRFEIVILAGTEAFSKFVSKMDMLILNKLLLL
jgi:hypothetical protein